MTQHQLLYQNFSKLLTLGPVELSCADSVNSHYYYFYYLHTLYLKNHYVFFFQWICEKQFDLHKKRALLKFFIDIFLDISSKSVTFSWYRHGLLYLKQAKYLTEILKQECAAFGDEVEEIMTIINKEEPKLMELLADGTENVPLENHTVELRPPNAPIANGDAPFLKRQVKSTPHFDFERNKLSSVEEMDLLTQKTAKTPRKTVAFNF